MFKVCDSGEVRQIEDLGTREVKELKPEISSMSTTEIG